jgi:hypothetical protein
MEDYESLIAECLAAIDKPLPKACPKDTRVSHGRGLSLYATRDGWQRTADASSRFARLRSTRASGRSHTLPQTTEATPPRHNLGGGVHRLRVLSVIACGC